MRHNRRRWWLLLLPVLALGWYVWQRLTPHSTIIFCSIRSGWTEIYRINDDGSGLRRIIEGSRGHQILYSPSAVVSPTGKQIAYQINDRNKYIQIWVADENGGNRRQVTPNGYAPLFFPDGRALLFYSNDHLYRVNSDGTGARQLTFGKGKNSDPCISPDGTFIVFRSWQGRNAYLDRMAADGSDRRRLTADPASYPPPVISPDGTFIVFAMQGSSANRDLYRINTDGSGLRRLTTDPGDDSDPAISPDGRWIAFTSERAGWDAIYLMDSNGGYQRRLTHELEDVYCKRPSFSPDGKRIAYQVCENGRNAFDDLCVINVNGRGRKALTNNRLRSLLYELIYDGRVSRFLGLNGCFADYDPVWLPTPK